MSHQRKTKTEHSGAKNGGGYWGSREEAKKTSNKTRRANDKKIIQSEKKHRIKLKAEETS